MFLGRIGKGLRIVALVGIFGAGYLCGTFGQRSMAAESPPLKKGSGSFGPTGDLGTSIGAMQQHVDALSKELENMRKINAALGL